LYLYMLRSAIFIFIVLLYFLSILCFTLYVKRITIIEVSIANFGIFEIIWSVMKMQCTQQLVKVSILIIFQLSLRIKHMPHLLGHFKEVTEHP
jgi:hypothetical protein